MKQTIDRSWFHLPWILATILSYSAASHGSTYPPNYCHQIVRSLSDGPALFVHVSSGCGAGDIIAYKNTGLLAADNPEYIEAIIVTTCGVDSEFFQKTTTVKLGKEWHQTGYMSEVLHTNAFLPKSQTCWNNPIKIEVAFKAKGNWDSRYGENYGHFGYGFYQDSRQIDVFVTNENGYSSPNEAAWEHIIALMREPRTGR